MVHGRVYGRVHGRVCMAVCMAVITPTCKPDEEKNDDDKQRRQIRNCFGDGVDGQRETRDELHVLDPMDSGEGEYDGKEDRTAMEELAKGPCELGAAD